MATPGLIDIGKNLVTEGLNSLPKGDIQEVVSKAFGSMEKTIGKTEPSQDALQILKEKYIPAFHKFHQEELDKNALLPPHQQAAPNVIRNKATNRARVHALGTNDAVIVKLVHAEANSGNPLTAELRSQNLANHVSMFLQDTVNKPKWTPKAKSQGQWGSQAVSSFKDNVLRNKENSVPLKDIGPTYTKQSALERGLLSYANNIMAPFIALNHLSTGFNLMSDTSLPSLAKGLADVMTPGGYSKIQQTLRDTGIFANTVGDAYSTMYEGQRGILAKAIGGQKGSEIGEIFAKLTHQPGFNASRTWTVALAGASGYHYAQELAQDLFDSGGKNKKAIYDLEQMGIKTADVLLQKGQLNPEQLKRAVFHFTDNHVFLDNRLARSYYARSSAFTRMGLMFHSYVANEGKFMLKQFVRMYKTGDVGAIAQTLATMGVVFPVVGHGIKYLEMAGRGQVLDIKHQMKQDYREIKGEEGIPTAVYQYLDGYAHMAAFGVATNYVRSATKTQLASALIGPIGNMGVRLGEDTLKATFGKTHNWEPLARDIVEDSPISYDNVGKWIAHLALPTTREESNRHPKLKLRPFKGKKGLKKLH